MTLQWVEDSGSRAATINRLGKKATSSLAVKFKCLGTFDDQEVHNQAANFFNTNRVYSAGGVTFLVDNYQIEHIGGDAWEVTANYESAGEDDGDVQKRSRQFDTSGGTAHISVGFDESKFGSGAPSMGNMIGVDAETVTGVDITVPALQWSETYDVPSGTVTDAYVKGVASITGCTNNSPFRGFAAGEVLFMGCSGSQQWDSEKGDGPWTLSFKFSASENVTGMTVGDIGGVSKKGWEYLWVVYESGVAGGTVVQKPKYVYSTAVYRSVSFSGLGIG